MPNPNTNLDKRRHDVVGLFLIYLATVGDCERTALAANVDSEIVRKLALSEDWDKKIKSITLASKSGGLQADEFARIQNRAIVWAQSSRLRQVLDRVVMNLHQQTDAELMEGLTEKTKEGNKKVNARVLVDLAKALETCSGMAFASLGDTIPERQTASPSDKASVASLHASLIACLNNPNLRTKASDALVAEVAQALDIESTLVPTEQAVERKDLSVPMAEEVGEGVGKLYTPPT